MKNRRRLLAAGMGAAVVPLVPLVTPAARAATATAEEAAAALATFTGGRPVQDDARVSLAMDELVENGNSVPVTVSVASPMTEAEHVRRIALFAPANPVPLVAVFQLTPASGRAQVSTRMRLATSQRVLALAETQDGRLWRAGFDVVVTLAACLE